MRIQDDKFTQLQESISICNIKIAGYDTSLHFIRDFIYDKYIADMRIVKDFAQKVEKLNDDICKNLRKYEQYRAMMAEDIKQKKHIISEVSALRNKIIKIERLLSTDQRTELNIITDGSTVILTKAQENARNRKLLKDMINAQA